MQTVSYINGLKSLYESKGFPAYQWSEYETNFWNEFKKPLKDSRVTLISSSGAYLEGQKPFDPWAVNDFSIRLIDVDAPKESMHIAHNYFDHRDAVKDINVVLPLDRLKELEKEGVIGELAPHAITLGMGRMYKRSQLMDQTVSDIIAVLEKEETDVVFLIPCCPLDHQSTALIARRLDEEGYPTMYLGACLDIMERVNPSRAAFINYPLGRNCGPAHDQNLQMEILKETLSRLEKMSADDGIAMLEYQWESAFSWDSYLGDLSAMLKEKKEKMQTWEPKK